MKLRKATMILLLCLALTVPMLTLSAGAKDLDEILSYQITADVNEDATVDMVYHIEWLVLDSTSEGPLSWVEIGIPNSHCRYLKGLSPAVRKISFTSGGGSYVRIDLDRDYRAGEVAVIEFSLEQDYLYEVNRFTEGETVYSFTPGWFDNIRVDEMVIKWRGDKVLSHSSDCLQTSDGYLTWTGKLAKGEQYTVTVTYPNDAYAFDETKGYDQEPTHSSDGAMLAVLFFFVAFIVIAVIIVCVIAGAYKKSDNFSGSTEKKITRTRVEYYPVCQGCGSTRPDGASNCSYCGRSFIKSEEIIQEEDIPKEESELRKKTTDGLYPYQSRPNTYIRVHVTPVRIPRPVIVPHSSSHVSHSSSRGSRSSSSCAHSSCACACACACAGGGRAGCTTKDFYNTDLKLRQLARISKR